tara:strand:- start:114 stop:524 length:411 start_codon:yes stop_codon:yes gene_type:complete
MPSAFLSYSQDWDGDGYKDIWGNRGDVFASIANYLKNAGWNSNYTWGRKVNIVDLHNKFNYKKEKKFLSDWSFLGIKTSDNLNLPNVKIKARLINPDNNTSEAFLVYENYESILKWNRSNHFAISVGLLSNSLINM